MEQEHARETAGEALSLQPDEALSSTDYTLTLSPEHKAAMLKERARALAHTTEQAGQDEGGFEVAAFLLGQEQYAFEAHYVREIYRLKDLTSIPGTPPHVLGIINVRGLMLAVLDLRTLFQLPQEITTDREEVVIIHAGGKEVGILTDGTLGVQAISTKDVYPAPPTLAGVRAKYLRGVTGAQLIILDAAKLLGGQDDSQHEEGSIEI